MINNQIVGLEKRLEPEMAKRQTEVKVDQAYKPVLYYAKPIYDNYHWFA